MIRLINNKVFLAIKQAHSVRWYAAALRYTVRTSNNDRGKADLQFQEGALPACFHVVPLQTAPGPPFTLLALLRIVKSMNPGSSRITTVIFDCGSVITFDQNWEYLCRMAECFNADPMRFKEVYVRERPGYDRGVLSAMEYWQRVASHFIAGNSKDSSKGISGKGISGTEVEKLIELDMKSWFTINPDVVALIAELKRKGLQLVVLSNMNEEGKRWMYGPARYCEGIDWISLFDQIMLSCDLKLLKPEPQIYAACLSRAGALPGHCVFIDDSEANVRAAQALGIHAIRFESAKQLVRHLSSQDLSVMSVMPASETMH